ncbi:MAG: hypothetical protein ACXAEU_14460 [Candidatus Hodarchaeales archaeon]|jgi:hypothetical protein
MMFIPGQGSGMVTELKEKINKICPLKGTLSVKLILQKKAVFNLWILWRVL